MSAQHRLVGVPLLGMICELKAASDRERFDGVIKDLTARDLSVSLSADSESRQFVLKGTSEAQLNSILDELRERHRIGIISGQPIAHYFERVSRKVDIDCTHATQRGGAGQFARVRILFEPGEGNSGFMFRSMVVGGAVPQAFVPSIKDALERAARVGVLAGFPVIDFKATLIDGAYHEMDSTAETFAIAAREAFVRLGEKNALELIEPVMRVLVQTDILWRDQIIADLKMRQGAILEIGESHPAVVITAIVPLADLFGFAETTIGRALLSAEYDHHRAVDGDNGPDDRFRPAMAIRPRR